MPCPFLEVKMEILYILAGAAAGAAAGYFFGHRRISAAPAAEGDETTAKKADADLARRDAQLDNILRYDGTGRGQKYIN